MSNPYCVPKVNMSPRSGPSTKVATHAWAGRALNLSTSHDVQWSHLLLIHQIQRTGDSAVNLTFIRVGCVVNTENVVFFWVVRCERILTGRLVRFYQRMCVWLYVMVSSADKERFKVLHGQ